VLTGIGFLAGFFTQLNSWLIETFRSCRASAEPACPDTLDPAIMMDAGSSDRNQDAESGECGYSISA
jgi:hypothetical protein